LPTHTENTQWIPALQKANKDELDNPKNSSDWPDFKCAWGNSLRTVRIRIPAKELPQITLWSLDEHIVDKLYILDKLWMNSINHTKFMKETQKQTDWEKHLRIEFTKEIDRAERDNMKRDYQ
jgi:hypothetical protein